MQQSLLTPAGSPPLTHSELYILLALRRGPLHAYDLCGFAVLDSQGALRLSMSHLRTVLSRLIEDRLIEDAGLHPAGPSGKERRHYAITKWGQVRLREDLLRLRDVVQIAVDAGYFRELTPPHIQRLELAQGLNLSAERP